MKRLLICGALLVALGGPARGEPAPAAAPDKASANDEGAAPTGAPASGENGAEGAEGASAADEAPADEGAPPPPQEPDVFQSDLDPEDLPRTGVAAAVGVFLKTLLALGFILLLAYLTLSKGVGKLVAKSQQGKDIRVVERIGLEQRRTLFLVEVDGRRLLIGTSEAGMTTLADLTHPAGARPFADVMQHTPAAPNAGTAPAGPASAEPA